MNTFKDLKIAVAGTGYVGLSIATLLAQHHEVKAVDVVPEKWKSLIAEFHRYRMNILRNIWRKSH